MPTINCPDCGREIQFPDFFYGTVVGCPAAGCGQRVQLPNADGTLPAEPTGMLPTVPVGPPPAAEYYFRKPFQFDAAFGPLPRERLRQMAREGKLRPADELSTDRKVWRPANVRDPGLFTPDRLPCRSCGAVVTGDGDLCEACATDEPVAGAYSLTGGPGMHVRALTNQLERRFAARRPLVDFASARAADAIVGVGQGGWLGLWTSRDNQPARTWEFDPGPHVRLAVADGGGRAVLAVGNARVTRLYLADFQFPRLRLVHELDGRVRALALDADGRTLGLVDDGPDVRLYRVEPWKRIDRFPVRGSRFAFGLADDRLAAANRDGDVRLYDLRSGKVTRELAAPRNQPACPQLPVRMAFSGNGKRLFAAAGVTVRFPREKVDGINPDAAFWLGVAAGGWVGGVAAAAVNDAVPDVWQNIRDARVAELTKKLYRQTALRVWETNGGGLMADYWNVFMAHPTGLVDAYFWPWGPAAATVGETGVHAFHLDGTHLGPVYEVTDAGEVQRAKAVQPEGGSLVRRVDFTPGGTDALVLVGGDSNIRQVPWPRGESVDEPSLAGDWR